MKHAMHLEDDGLQPVEHHLLRLPAVKAHPERASYSESRGARVNARGRWQYISSLKALRYPRSHCTLFS
jgi:hypothetical protein